MSTFDVGVGDQSRQEGRITSEIEERTTNLPSLTFLTLAGGSIAASLSLFILGRREDAIFVGTWAPTFLILGLYNKLVKELETTKPMSAGVRH